MIGCVSLSSKAKHRVSWLIVGVGLVSLLTAVLATLQSAGTGIGLGNGIFLLIWLILSIGLIVVGERFPRDSI